MADEHDSWLEGIGVDVGSVLQTAQQAVGDINAVADVSVAPSQGGQDDQGGTFDGVVKAAKTGVRVFQAVNQGRKVAGAVGSGAAVAVGAAGFAAGVLLPAAVGYLLDHGEELQQQPDPDEQSLPGGAPPAQGNSGSGDPLDGGAPSQASQGGDAVAD